MPHDEGTPPDPAAEDPLADAGDGGLRPPPHPDDRLWRHPSELRRLPPPRPLRASSTRLTSVASRGRRPSGTSWPTVALAGGISAAVTAAAMVWMGVPERTVERTVTERVAVTPAVSSLDGIGDPRLPGQRTNGAGPLSTSSDPHPSEAAIVHIVAEGTEGSGFLIRDDGTVLTSASAVGNPDAATADDLEVAVTTADGRQIAGTVRGTDPITDLAVVSLPPGTYPTTLLAEQATGGRGQPVAVAARQDDGTTGWVPGILSSSSWRLERPELPALDGLLQIAVGAGPGDVGGPVVGGAGAVVGVTTRSTADWAYAIPIEVATKVADDLLTDGRARHPRLGIVGDDTDDEMLTAGVIVTDVFDGTAADGVLAPDDVIVALDGAPVPDMTTLQTRLLLLHPDDEVQITYYRADHDRPLTAVVILDER